MKRFVMTIALTLAVSGVAFAGDVPSVGITATDPDDPTTTTINATAPGDIPTVGLTDEISESALSLIQIMVGLVV
jgi:hypothetical protein